MKRGRSYRQLLAAVYMVAIRNRTSSHHVFMMNSVHPMGLDVGRDQRLLPLMWAVDAVKSRYTKPEPIFKPVKDSQLPSPDKAAAQFETAMQRADFEEVDRAIVALARSEADDGVTRLHGELACPDSSSGPFGTLLIVPGGLFLERDGFMGNTYTEADLMYRRLGQRVLHSGYAVARYDNRGVTGNEFTIGLTAEGNDS